jgi:hypothetical protein
MKKINELVFRFESGGGSLSMIERCIAYTAHSAPETAAAALDEVNDLENKIEALQEERGDLLVMVEAIVKLLAPFLRGEK